MKNPDNGKIKFKIMVDSTVTNIVDEAGNKLTTTFESQILEHHDDSVIDVISFTYDKVDDSYGILTLTTNQEIISVDGSNKVNGLKLKYKTNEYVIANGDFVLQDNKKEIKATVRPFILFNETTVNTVDFIAEFIPTADIIGNRNKDLVLLNQSKTFTHSDVSAPSITDITFNQNTNILSINLSETIVDLGEVDYGTIKIKKEDGTLENLGISITNIHKLKVSPSRKSLEIDLTNLREANFANEPLTKIIKFGIMFDANVNNIKDFVGNLCSTIDSVFGENFVLKQPKDVFVLGGTEGSLNDPEILEVDLTFDYITSIAGNTTTVDNQPDRGFYVVNNNKRYPLENCITHNNGSQMRIQFKPFELLYDVMPDEYGRIEFEFGYDPTIGNLISRFGETFDAFETKDNLGFGYNDFIKITDWKIESLLKTTDPSGKLDHISTDRVTITFNKNVENIENSELIGKDISLNFLGEYDYIVEELTFPIAFYIPQLGITFNENIKDVTVLNNTISFNANIAELCYYMTLSGVTGAIGIGFSTPHRVLELRYKPTHTTIKDNHRNEVKEYRYYNTGASDGYLINRENASVVSCNYNQIDSDNGEVVIILDDYPTHARTNYLRIDINNTGYSSAIGNITESDYNKRSLTQKFNIKTKELFNNNGIGTTGLSEFKICFGIDLFEIGYMCRLNSPNTPDRNYYFDASHTF